MKLTINRIELQKAVEKLIRAAASRQHNGGEVQLYAEVKKGKVTEFVYHEVAGNGSSLEAPDLIYIARDRWFDPLHDEDYQEWWRNEGRSGKWEDLRDNSPGEWIDLLAEWQECQIDDNIRDWVSAKINLIIDELEQEYDLEIVEDRKLKEYVGAVWLAERLGMTQQNVSLAGQRALKPTYRGDFLKPDASVEGRPLWEKGNAIKYVRENAKMNRFEAIEMMIEELGARVDGKAVWEWIETQVGNSGLDGRHILTQTLGGVKIDFHIEVSHVELGEDEWATDIHLSKISKH